jgi:hypothetical protein
MPDDNYLNPPGLPWDDDDPGYGLTGYDALRNLLNHAEILSDKTFDFVHSCANFPKLSRRQEAALINTWRIIDAQIMAKRARLLRQKRRRSTNNGGTTR